MGRLVWNDPSDRRLRGGVDHAVLYMPGQAGIAWNGITSVVQKNTVESESLWFDGRRYAIDVVPGAFDGSISAFGYPDKFEPAQGFVEIRPGVYVDNQQPTTFGFSYRTLIRSASSQELGYKIHVIWGLKAVPTEQSHITLGGDEEIAPFLWDISAIPSDLPGALPTAHMAFDSTKIDPWLMEDIENVLYGDENYESQLPPMIDLYTMVQEWARFWVVENEDGETVTGTEARFGHIFPTDNGEDVVLKDVNVVFIDDDTFELGNVYNLQDLARIVVRDNKNGTITITSSDLGSIVDVGDGDVLLSNIELSISGPDMFSIKTNTEPR